jgi:1-acyl-sn-glycerol-3-phosphate acyltransferase
MVVSTLIWGPVVLLSWPLSLEQRYAIAQRWSRFNVWWLKKTCRIDYHLTGMENLPHDRPAIILAKHQSTWETLFLNQFLPLQTMVLKRELLRIPLFGWALALLEPIAIERNAGGAALRRILKRGKQSLDDGRWVVLFPEGTRTAPGERRPYGTSGAKLAAHSGYPIIPLAHNAGEFWPRRGFLKRPGTIQVVFGPVIPVGNRKAKELNALAELWIEETMAHIDGSSELAKDVEPTDTRT